MRLWGGACRAPSCKLWQSRHSRTSRWNPPRCSRKPDKVPYDKTSSRRRGPASPNGLTDQTDERDPSSLDGSARRPWSRRRTLPGSSSHRNVVVHADGKRGDAIHL